METIIFDKLQTHFFHPFSVEDVLVHPELEEHELIRHTESLFLQFQRLMQSVALLAQITQQIALQGLEDDAIVLLEIGLNKYAKEVIDIFSFRPIMRLI